MKITAMKLRALAGVLAVCVAAPAAAEDEHIFCKLQEKYQSGGKELRVFYGGVFFGDYGRLRHHQSAFRDYVLKNYSDVVAGGAYCFFERDPARAVRRLERDAKSDERQDIYDTVIMTGWTPDDFSRQALQDFNIAISGGSADLEICVRDHECEDGDKVRVSVDGGSIFSGEIDNDWDCDEVRVQAGRDYAVELYAINGTGHKGACSHRDVNTGEIRVRGATAQTQSWRHRGGAGSRARIIVRAK